MGHMICFHQHVVDRFEPSRFRTLVADRKRCLSMLTVAGQRTTHSAATLQPTASWIRKKGSFLIALPRIFHHFPRASGPSSLHIYVISMTLFGFAI